MYIADAESVKTTGVDFGAGELSVLFLDVTIMVILAGDFQITT